MNLQRLAGLILLGIGACAVMAAAPPVAPEIDPASGVNALALAAGALLVIRGRRK
jgi:hypothetical protein